MRMCGILTDNGDGDCALSGGPETRSLCLVGWTRGKVFGQSWQVGTFGIPTSNLSW